MRSPGSALPLEHKADRDDVTEAIERLTRAIEQTYGLVQAPYAREDDGDSGARGAAGRMRPRPPRHTIVV